MIPLPRTVLGMELMLDKYWCNEWMRAHGFKSKPTHSLSDTGKYHLTSVTSVFSSVKWDNKDHHPFPGNTEKAKFEPKMSDCCPGWGKEDAATVLAGEALIGVSDSGKGLSCLQAGGLHTSEFPRLEMLPSLHLL